MNRRRFLGESLASGSLALAAGGYLLFRRSQARAAVTLQMLDDALPPLAANGLHEFNTLPGRAREEIRRYFHGKCLNVEGFVTHICSNSFAEVIGRCRTQEEREACFLQAFCGRIATEAEIRNQVETIAAEVGSELDLGWDQYCSEMSARWNSRVRAYGRPLALDELAPRLDGMLRTELSQAVHEALLANRKPALGETIGKVGTAAILLLPVFESIGLALPLFVILAARPVWEFVSARLEDRRGDQQAAISGRLALLGNRVGTELEREVRERLTDLHSWQERSIRQLATHLAQERVGLI
jgi:hypothetical protein